MVKRKGKKKGKGAANNKTAIPIQIPADLSRPKLNLKCICRDSIKSSQLNKIEFNIPSNTRVGQVLEKINSDQGGILMNLTLSIRNEVSSTTGVKIGSQQNNLDAKKEGDNFVYQSLDNFKSFEDQGIKDNNKDGIVELYYDFNQDKTTTKDFSLYGSDTNGPLLRISKSFKNLFREDILAN